MVSSSTANHQNVIVIGGGPAGATVSTLIAQKGYSVSLFERETFPRYHIGESMIPETFDVLDRLHVLPKLRTSHFVKKHSVQFVTGTGKLSEPFYFADNKPHESSQTWQVVRSEFDLMMLRNASDHGVDVHEGARVLDVIFDKDRAVGVKLAQPAGGSREIFADVVIDAAGQSGILQDRLGLREWDPVLKKAALWTYWKGAYRDGGKDEGATIVMQLDEKQGWFWYIPLHDDVLSVGVVAPHEYLFGNRATKDHERIYYEEVARCPGLQPRIANATRAAPFRAAKEYSYRAREVAGDGWVLVGDAYGFLDPLYSSGVLLALRSGAMAADCVCEGLAKGDTSARQLGSWGPGFNKGMDRMRRLVCEFYDGFNFGGFVKKHPHLKGHLTDLLIGDLFTDAVDDVIAPMDAFRIERQEAVQSNASSEAASIHR